MKKLLMLSLLILLTSCSDNESHTGFIANEADSSEEERVYNEVKSDFNFEEYNEFPDYNTEDTNDFLHRLLVVSLLNDNLDDQGKTIVNRIALGDDEYHRRLGEIGDNPFKKEELTETTYQEVQDYGNSVQNNRKFVFDIDYESYYINLYGESETDKKLITAIARGYDDDKSPLKSYILDQQYFPLFGVNSVSIDLETRGDINRRKIDKYLHVRDEPYSIRMDKLYVSDRKKAEKIQDLIDKEELGMAGKVYIEFIDDEYSRSNVAHYKINGIVLDFYDKNTNEILERAQEFRSL